MVNVSIVTYHTPEQELHVCLQSLQNCKLINRIDIIDNGSEQRLELFFRNNYPLVRYIANQNTGYGAAHNISMQQSIDQGVKYHLVLNSDIYFNAGTIERCIDYMDNHPQIGQLIPAVTFPDGSFQPVCHPLPTPWNLISHRFLPHWINTKARNRYEMRCYDMTQPINVPYHHGCFMLFRSSVLKEIGLFDSRYFMYPEDIDITRRIHAHYQTIYYPHVSIVHAHRAQSKTNLRLLWIHITNILKYFRK